MSTSITGLNIRKNMKSMFGFHSDNDAAPPVVVSAGGTGRVRKAPTSAATTGRGTDSNALVANIQNVQEKIALIEKKLDFLDTKVENERKLAKQCLNRNDQVGAKSHLVSSRQHQKQIKTLNAHRNNLQQMAISLETAQDNTEFVKTTKQMNDVLRKTTMNADQVDDIIADAAEAQQMVNEVTDLTSQSIYEDPDTAVDESDLDALLADVSLEDEPTRVKSKKAAPAIPGKKAAPKLPVAPTHALNQEYDSDEEQLRKLEVM
jgi:hypothetical protein